MTNMHAGFRSNLTSFILCAGLLLIGCDSAQKAESCKKLGTEYQFLTGQVIETDIKIVEPVGDCFTKECWRPQEGRFFAVLNIISPPNSQQIKVVMPSEDLESLKQKKPYMLVSRQYSFCAKGPIKGGADFYATHPMFYIKYLKTIKII